MDTTRDGAVSLEEYLNETVGSDVIEESRINGPLLKDDLYAERAHKYVDTRVQDQTAIFQAADSNGLG